MSQDPLLQGLEEFAHLVQKNCTHWNEQLSILQEVIAELKTGDPLVTEALLIQMTESKRIHPPAKRIIALSDKMEALIVQAFQDRHLCFRANLTEALSPKDTNGSGDSLKLLLHKGRIKEYRPSKSLLARSSNPLIPSASGRPPVLFIPVGVPEATMAQLISNSEFTRPPSLKLRPITAETIYEGEGSDLL